jgi:hypothetical protein
LTKGKYVKHLAQKTLSFAVAAAFLSGCASGPGANGGAAVTASVPSHFTRSGFLSDYTRLKPASWGGGLECWRDAHLNASQYDKVMISRIVVSLKPKAGEAPTIDPSDLKMLTDYFHDALVTSLKPQMKIVTAPEPDAIVMRIALTSLVPTEVSRSVAGTLVPYGFVAEAGSGTAAGLPAGATPYLGETGMEMQFLDGASGTILGECRDAQIGRKYAADMDSGAAGAAETWANGYLNSFQAWSYSKNAIDKWSLLVAQRFAQLRNDPTLK